MLGLLLLFFYPHCWAEEVCFNMTNYDLQITIGNATITDNPGSHASCSLDKFDCCLLCWCSDETEWFRGSSACLKATMKPSGNTTEIIIKENISCTLHLCTNVNIMALMHSLKKLTEGLMELFYIRNSCPFLFSQDDDLKKLYIRKERNLIHTVMDTLDDNFTSHDLTHMSINVMNISEDDLNTQDRRININMPQLVPQLETYIPEVWFPVDALCKIPEQKRAIGAVSYMLPDTFEIEPVNISSVVIRLELLEGKRLQHLNPPIEMIFRNVVQSISENDTVYACHYFDEHEFVWKTDGCKTEIITLNNSIICSCDHMTPFALLLIRIPIETIHWQILSYISYIGCGLSAFFTALSIAIYLFSLKKADHSIAIHVSLSGALFLLNTTFLLTEWGARVKPDWVCVLVAAAMHYSLLCSFTWMALEAVHLYLLLIKVFNTNYKRYMFKMSVAGWGIPAIIVSISAGVKDNDFYGVTETTMAGSNQTSAICWIVDDSFFYSVNLVYFTLIFMFNSGILMTVASSICKMKKVFKNVNVRRKDKKQWPDPDRFSESCKSGLTVLGLTCLMGTTWGLAFLGSGFVNYPVLYLFCIFNSTQGFFIFIWICLSTNKQKKREQEDKITSSLAKTSTTKTE